MPIVVQKYGGSSVADVEKLRRVARRVVDTAQAGKQVCVVVSAMGDTTDDLIGLAQKVSLTPPRRELDMLLSCGERITMALLSMAIADLGHEAISFTGSQSGIMTNDRHSGARIIEVRPIRIQDELEHGRIVIVAGFQGVSYKREITTLGRGGSDTTAVALAAALSAEYCEICSDVDGVYTADPRIVDAPRLLHAISYDEMQELAEHGAKVLNPQAIEFARRAGIAIYARATAQSSASDGGTRVGVTTADRRGAVGVTGLKDLTRVRVLGAQHADSLGAALARDRVHLLRFVTDPEGVTAIFSRDDVPDWPAVHARLNASVPLHCEENLAAATVVGEGIGSDPSTLDRAYRAANAANIEVSGSDAAPLRLTLYVAPAQLSELVRVLHAAFLEA